MTMTIWVRTAVLIAGAYGGPGGDVNPEPALYANPVTAHVVSGGIAIAQEDDWLGSDKFTHVGMSFATTAFAFAAASIALDGADGALIVAVPVGFAAGVGKEISDRRSGRTFSYRDLAADAIGVALAWLVLREVD